MSRPPSKKAIAVCLAMCGVLTSLLSIVQQMAWAQSRSLFIRPGVGVSELFVLNHQYQASLQVFQKRYSLATSIAPTLTFQDQNGTRFFDFFQFGLRLVVHDDVITQLVFLAPAIFIKGERRTITTVTGIRVGTPESLVERVYGKPSRQAQAAGGRVWYYTCIGFDLSDANRNVRAILVYSTPRGRCEN